MVILNLLAMTFCQPFYTTGKLLLNYIIQIKTNQDGVYYKDIIKELIRKREMDESIDEYRYVLKALPQVVQHQYVENARGLLRQSLVFYKERLIEPGLLDHFLSKLNCNYSTEKSSPSLRSQSFD